VSKVWVVRSNFTMDGTPSCGILAIATTQERAEAEATNVAWSYGMSPLTRRSSGSRTASMVQPSAASLAQFSMSRGSSWLGFRKMTTVPNKGMKLTKPGGGKIGVGASQHISGVGPA
jgi:hypothetical protein